MSRIRLGAGIAAVTALALTIPVSALAQGDPAPRGGAGTNLPGANGAASAAAAEARMNNAAINTPPVTTNPAGAPNTADPRAVLRDQMQKREAPMSPFEMYQRLEAIREGRAGGAETSTAATGTWYSNPGGGAVITTLPQRGLRGGTVQDAGETNDPNRCLGVYEQIYGPTASWDHMFWAAVSGCNDGGLNRAVHAWNNRTPPRIGTGDFYDPRMYWGSPNASGMGYSQRSGGFSRAYAAAGLKLDVTPTDASVYVDGFYAGQVADFDGQIRRLPLNPGPHRVEFVARGLEPLVINAEVADGQTATFTGQLTRKK